MKTNKLITLALMVSITVLFSCKSKTSETAATSENPVVSETSTPKGKYAIKSGIVEYKTQTMGMDMKQTLTFDDYGKKEATDLEMDMMGVKVHTVTITKDGFMYTLDMEKKTGTKVPSYQGSNQNIDFENLSEQMVKDMNLKKEGTEDYLGKTCEKMSIDYTKMQMKGTFLVYKGVALQSDIDMGTMKMKLIGEKFIENPEIPAGKFEVPVDIKIIENQDKL
jgi:outer membrane lipoprotein-sorting protein